MSYELSHYLVLAGVGQLSVLVASAQVPFQLNWKTTLAPLPPLIRQLFWIYGSYIVLTIVCLGTGCLIYSEELAAGGPLARGVCIYGALFWGIRLAIQPFLAAKPFLTTWWLRAGYHSLTILFASFTLIFIYAALR